MPSSDMLDFIGPIEAGFRMAQQAGQFRLQQQRQQQEAAEQRQIMGQRAAQMQVAQRKLQEQLKYEAEMDQFKQGVQKDVSDLSKLSLATSAVTGAPEFQPEKIQELAFQKNLHKLPAEEIVKIMPAQQRNALAEDRLLRYVDKWKEDQRLKADATDKRLQGVEDTIAARKAAEEAKAKRGEASVVTFPELPGVKFVRNPSGALFIAERPTKAIPPSSLVNLRVKLAGLKAKIKNPDTDESSRASATAEAHEIQDALSEVTQPTPVPAGTGQPVKPTGAVVDPNDPLGILKK